MTTISKPPASTTLTSQNQSKSPCEPSKDSPSRRATAPESKFTEPASKDLLKLTKRVTKEIDRQEFAWHTFLITDARLIKQDNDSTVAPDRRNLIEVNLLLDNGFDLKVYDENSQVTAFKNITGTVAEKIKTALEPTYLPTGNHPSIYLPSIISKQEIAKNHYRIFIFFSDFCDLQVILL